MVNMSRDTIKYIMDANLISDPRRQRECCTGSVGGQPEMIHKGSESDVPVL